MNRPTFANVESLLRLKSVGVNHCVNFFHKLPIEVSFDFSKYFENF